VIDARRDYERARHRETGRNVFAIGGDSAEQLLVRAHRQGRIHVVGGRREDECVEFVVEEDPGPVSSELLEAEATERGGIGEVVEITWIMRNGGKRFARLACGQEGQLENRYRAMVVDADRTEPHGGRRRLEFEFDLPVTTGAISAPLQR
jgi:hypothetical protein